MKNNGFIFAIVEKLIISIKGRVIYVSDPTFLQVRNGQNSTGLAALGAAAVVYENSPVTISFDNLEPSAHYRIVMFATSEDPSAYKLITSSLSALEATLPTNANLIATAIISLLLCLFI